MSNITIVIPVHEVNDDLKKLYAVAIGSIPITAENKSMYPVMLVGPKDVLNGYKDEKIEKVVEIEYVENEKSDFQTQMNVAAQKCKTPYFSILEVDDSYNPNWFKNVEKHIETMPEVSFFLPLTEVFDVSTKEAIPVGFANEIALTVSFSDRIGYIGKEDLENFSDFSCTGGVYKTADFIEIGGLKASLKIVFWYEFLMRAANNHKEIYVIPKLGYRHNLRREGSLMEIMSSTVKEEDVNKLFELAKQECFFNEDRNRSID